MNAAMSSRTCKASHNHHLLPTERLPAACHTCPGTPGRVAVPRRDAHAHLLSSAVRFVDRKGQRENDRGDDQRKLNVPKDLILQTGPRQQAAQRHRKPRVVNGSTQRERTVYSGAERRGDCTAGFPVDQCAIFRVGVCDAVRAQWESEKRGRKETYHTDKSIVQKTEMIEEKEIMCR
jgi:hypothetical protein